MKYGYSFHDWSIYEIDELEEVQELQQDLTIHDCFGDHVFEKDKWCWVRCTKAIFLHPTYDGKHFHHTENFEGPYYKEHIFDTRGEAIEYARAHCDLHFL